MSETLSPIPFRELPPVQKNELLYNLYESLPVQAIDEHLLQFKNKPLSDSLRIVSSDSVAETIEEMEKSVSRRQKSSFKTHFLKKAQEYLSFSQTTQSFKNEFIRVISRTYDTGISSFVRTQQSIILDTIMENSSINTAGIYEKEESQIIEKLAYEKELGFYLEAKNKLNSNLAKHSIPLVGSIEELDSLMNKGNKTTVDLYLPILKSWRTEYNDYYQTEPFDFQI